MTTRKLLFGTLLAATLSSGFLVACTNGNSNEGEKQALASQTKKQKELSAQARDKQNELDLLVAENKEVKAEQERIAAEQEKLQLELDAQTAAVARSCSKRWCK